MKVAKGIKSRSVKILSWGILTALALFLFPLLGRTCYSPALYFSGNLFSMAAPEAQILTERFIDTLLAMTAGSGLALAGLILQTLFRNPLASPYTLGIASGSAFGASLWLFLTPVLGVGNLFGIPGVCGAGLLGALAATKILFFLSRGQNLSSERILLTGIAASFFFSSLTLFIQYLAEQGESFRIIRWTMGGIDSVYAPMILPLLAVVLLSAGLLFLFSRELDLLLTGEEKALSLGVNLNRMRLLLFFLSSLLVGVIVAVCGPIGFVGLMVPHFCRLLFGWEHRSLIPASALFGAIFLGACFTLSRIIFYPDVLPVGVLTSLLGGLFFLWLLGRKKRSRLSSGR